MLTIQHCDSLHVHLPGQGNSILTEAVLTALDTKLGDLTAPTAVVQTSAALQPPALGELWPGQGGYYAGIMPPRAGKPGYHLVLAVNQCEPCKFGPYDHDVAGAKDHWDGLANTVALAIDRDDHPAADWAKQRVADGHEDFYLPAHAELCQLWINVPQLFKKEGWYWSSTQHSPDDAWVQYFEYGTSYFDYKDYECRAVAVRRLAI